MHRARRVARDARRAITSFAFMFDDVPEPVWNTSIGNWSSNSPAATSSAAAAIASPTGFVDLRHVAQARVHRAASRLDQRERADQRARSIGSPEIGKFSTARWVCAPQCASAGTRTSPIESCSTRYVRHRPLLPVSAAPQGTVFCMVEFAYQEMLPLGADDTPYRLLTERLRHDVRRPAAGGSSRSSPKR